MIPGFEKWTKEMSDSEIRKALELAPILREAEGKLKSMEIMKLLNMKILNTQQPAARVRKIIHFLRVSGVVPCLISDGGGYWVSSDSEKIQKHIEGLRKRVRSITEVADCLQEQLDELKGDEHGISDDEPG